MRRLKIINGGSSGNSKIKNATKCEFEGIKFKSKLELFCYKKLKEFIPDPGYESWKEVLMRGFYPTVNIYEPNKNKQIELNTVKIRDITYTPDFSFVYKSHYIFIDTKGASNDVYPVKKKMFFNNFQGVDRIIDFFEPHSQSQVLQCIEIIKQL